MKKITKSVLTVVLASSFVMVNAQKSPKKDTIGTKQVEEVLITGALGIKKISNAVTSASQVVDTKQINQANNPNAVSALVGKVSGLTITSTNTSVNGSNRIELRAPKSISADNQALVVIDDVFSSATMLAQLAPDQIDNVTVIKGMQGAALYGSAGINGAVIVTTKRGSKSNKVNVSYNGSVEFDMVNFLPERQSSYGQGWIGDRIAVENGSWGPAFSSTLGGQMLPYGIPLSDADGDGLISVNPNDAASTPDYVNSIQSKYAPYGDNVRDFFQKGITYQNNVSINFGGRESYINFAINNTNREFVVENDKLKRTAILFKAGKKMGDFTIDGTVNYISQITSETSSDIYHDLLQSAPDIPITKFKGLVDDRAYAWNMYYFNPYYNIKHVRYNNNSTNINGIIKLGYTINKNLNLTYTANVRNQSSNSLNTNDGYSNPKIVTVDGDELAALTSSMSQNNFSSFSYYGDLMLNMDYDLSDKVNFKANIGFNNRDSYSTTTSAGGTNLIIPGLYQIYNLSNPTLPYNVNNRSFRQRSIAAFANVDLSYSNFLFLNSTLRYEKTSVLVKGNNDYIYPSVGLSFVPTKAFEGLKNSVINNIKVFGSWVRVGNIGPVGAYSIEPTLVLGGGFPFPTTGPTGGSLSFVNQSSPTDRMIKPEFNTSKEVGVNLGFFKNNRVTIDATYFVTDTKDLITRSATSATSGTIANFVNIGALQGTGLEIDLGLTPIKSESGDFSWNIRASLATNETRVIKVSADSKEVALSSGGANVGIFATEGELFPLLKGSKYQRNAQGNIIVDAVTGNPLYSSDLQSFGTTRPKYIYGLNTSIDFKGFKLSATMDYRTGHVFYSGTMNTLSFSGSLMESANFDRTQGGWVIPNSVLSTTGAANTSVKTGGGTYSTLVNYFGSTHNLIAENFVYNASALKLRELALSYSFKKDLLSSAGLNDLTVGVYARNPFVKFHESNKGYNDPETSFSNGNASGIANDNQYPNLKTYGMNVAFSF